MLFQTSRVIRTGFASAAMRGALTAFRTAVAPEAISTIHLSGNVSKAEKPARQLSPLPVVSTWHSQGLQRMITLLQALDPALCERHH